MTSDITLTHSICIDTYMSINLSNNEIDIYKIPNLTYIILLILFIHFLTQLSDCQIFSYNYVSRFHKSAFIESSSDLNMNLEYEYEYITI